MKKIVVFLLLVSSLFPSGCTRPKQYADYSRHSCFDRTEIDSATLRNLEVLGRVWGFVKYHHPAFSDDRYDLDFELFELLPLVADTAPAARNEILAQWIDGFGRYKTASENTRRYWRRIRFLNTAPTSDGFGIRQRSAASFRSVWSGCVLPTEPQGTVTCRKRITKPMTNGPPIPVSTEKTLLRLVESRLRLSPAHGIPFLEHGRIFLSK